MPRQRKLGGGRFNRNKSLSFFDRTIRAAKDLPGPASHNIQMDNRVSGGRFNLSRPKTFVEEEIYRGLLSPPVPSMIFQHATAFAMPRHSIPKTARSDRMENSVAPTLGTTRRLRNWFLCTENESGANMDRTTVKDLPSAADTTTSRPWGFTGHYRTTGTDHVFSLELECLALRLSLRSCTLSPALSLSLCFPAMPGLLFQTHCTLRLFPALFLARLRTSNPISACPRRCRKQTRSCPQSTPF